MCSCEIKRVKSDTEDQSVSKSSTTHILRQYYSADECIPIFGFAKDAKILHATDDDLQDISISMNPDRVMGLRAPSNIPHNEDLCPIAGRRQIMLPFLVIEAKKEDGGPGFQAMQFQTAFPIRRFLLAQTNFKRSDASCEPSIVWFFAYQGEQWRLHFCVGDGQKVV
jgi:hypothetical protein